MVDLCTFWKGLLQCWLTETTLLQPARSNQTFKISSGEVGLKLFHFLVDLQLCQIKIIQKKDSTKQQWWLQFQYYTTRSLTIVLIRAKVTWKQSTPQTLDGNASLLNTLDLQESMCYCEVCGFMIFRTREMTHSHNNIVVLLLLKTLQWCA